MFRRPMAFGGTWYPADPAACERAIRGFWADPLPDGLAPARFGVVPHAGWVFSGALAGRVFQALAPDDGVELVVVLGGHLGSRDPVVAMTEGVWETPFGDMPAYAGLHDALAALPHVVFEGAGRLRPDNSVELQLPFARYKYPRARVLTVRVPPSDTALEVGRLLAGHLAQTGIRAVAVASTDLTHYGPAYDFEPQGRGEAAYRWATQDNDGAFIEALQAGDGARLLRESAARRNACSAGAVAALGEVAAQAGQRFAMLGYATSRDARGGDSHNFVGYLAGVYQ